MIIKTLAVAAALSLSLAGAALAQRPADGSVEGNMNNPGSVKSNAEKRDEAITGSATGGPVTTGTATGTGTVRSGVGADTGISTGTTAPAR